MIVEYVRYRIPESRSDEFEAAYKKAAEHLLKSVYCQHYEISRGVEEPELYTVRIEWDSLHSHMQGFRNSQEFRDFLVHVRPFFRQIEEMQHYEVLATSK